MNPRYFIFFFFISYIFYDKSIFIFQTWNSFLKNGTENLNLFVTFLFLPRILKKLFWHFVVPVINCFSCSFCPILTANMSSGLQGYDVVVVISLLPHSYWGQVRTGSRTVQYLHPLLLQSWLCNVRGIWFFIVEKFMSVSGKDVAFKAACCFEICTSVYFSAWSGNALQARTLIRPHTHNGAGLVSVCNLKLQIATRWFWVARATDLSKRLQTFSCKNRGKK